MSVKALTWAFKLRLGGRASAKLVLIDLADHANEADLAWPKVSTIAERTELSESTVLRELKSIEEWGLIEREKRRSVIGRPRANLYTLRTDRKAPVDLSEQTVTMTVGENRPSKNDDLPTASEEARAADRHHDSHEIEPADSHGDGHVGVKVKVTNRTVTLEPRLPPTPTGKPAAETPWPHEADSAEAVALGFHTAEETYQQLNLLKFFGDSSANWKYWRKLPLDKRVKALSRLSHCLKGCKAQFARWREEKPGDRGRRPGVPNFRDYLADEIYEAMGAPSPETAEKNAADLAAVRLCRSISQRERFDSEVWVVEGSEQWRAWVTFFRANGQHGIPVRASIFADRHDLGAEQGERGWRFPSAWPPGHDEQFETEENEQLSA